MCTKWFWIYDTEYDPSGNSNLFHVSTDMLNLLFDMAFNTKYS